ncbi:MAG: YqgE/AlgH family protein [Microbacteriaceae bacterium]|nr:YqgE/AlgH family protein [Microbacteriaceae bacterium]
MSKEQLKTGTVLVASPRLTDAFFAKNVILLVDHDDLGTIGVNIAGTPRADRFCLGGPMPGIALLVRKMTDEMEGKLEELGDTGFGCTSIGQEVQDGPMEPADLLKLDDSLLLLGYGGWGAGQLAGEMDMGAWQLTTKTLAEIMAVPNDQRYALALQGTV